ncbi:hypothetical protein [Tropicibacter sp. S64]|uniref:hypothetical protein n=1 Tax=Tropicibacter sp. S64 TaxID=3415122 RepID=UPI003C7E6F5B
MTTTPWRIAPALLALLATKALAEPTQADLVDRVGAYEALMLDGQVAASLDYMPPSLLATVAEQAGTDPEGMRKMMREQVQASIDGKPLWGAKFEVPLDDLTIGETDSGRAYAVLASYSAFPSLGIPEVSAPLVALVEDEAWYLVRVESPMHLQVLAQVYPDLGKVLTGMETPQ